MGLLTIAPDLALCTRTGKCLSILLLGLALLILSALACAAELTLSCGQPGPYHRRCAEAAQSWADAKGHRVRVLAAAEDLDRRLQTYQELLGVATDQLDVLEIDVIWTGLLAEHLADLRPLIADAHTAFMQTLVASNRVKGRLVALPRYLEFGLLFYRKDLLEQSAIAVPRTWAELESAASRLQDAQRHDANARFWGFLWPGGPSEALTCTALEWVASWNGGTIATMDGTITIDDLRAQYALKRATNWLKIVSPESVLTATEEEPLIRFASGNAGFLRAWPSAWAKLNAPASAVRGKVGVAPLPKGGSGGVHAATLGGWQLAVSRYSAHPELAADLVLHLTGDEEQRQNALQLGLPPSRKALLVDPEIRAAQPYLDFLDARDVLIVARPSASLGEQYPEASKLFQAAVSDVLSGRRAADQALPTLARELVRLRRGGTW